MKENPGHNAIWEVLEGPPLKYLFVHSLRVAVGLASLTSLSLVDVWFVGKLGGDALAAISFAAPVFLIGLSLMLGLGAGITTVTSHKVGGRDLEEVGRLGISSLVLSLIVGILVAFVGWGLHEPVFRQMGVTPDLNGLVYSYMQVVYPGFVLIAILVGCLSLIRSFGDTKIPVRVMVLIVVMNAILDPVLIFGWGIFPELGIAGASWATCIALLFGCLYAVYHLRRFLALPAEATWSWSGAMFKWNTIGRIAIPVSLTRAMMPFSSALVIGLLSAFGEDLVAAYGIGYRLDVTLAMYPIAVSSVAAPFVGQNAGASQLKRLRTGIRISLLLAFAYGFVMAGILGLLNIWVPSQFTEDNEIAGYLGEYLILVPWGYAFSGVLVVCTSLLNALFKPVLAMMISLVHLFVLYLPFAWLAHGKGSYQWIFLAYPVATLVASALAFGLLFWRVTTMKAKSSLYL